MRDINSHLKNWIRNFAMFLPVAFASPAMTLGAGLTTPTAALQSRIIPGQFIVTMAPEYSADSILREHGLRAKHIYQHTFNGFAGGLSDETIARLRADHRIVAIEPDQMIHAYGAQSSPTWGLDRIDQRNLPLDASYSFSSIGNGVTAYIIDTGIRTAHTEFGGRAFVGFDAFGGNGQDCNGHGTHVAGTVGGTNYGVAKNTRLIAIRVLDCNGSGTTSGVIAGIDWVTKNRILPAVANLSLGGGTSTALDTALQNMIFSGVATAVAAGNSGADACKYSPARVPAAMTIGASNSSDAKASWSNYGKCVDWFAPGVSITSAWYSSNSATNTISGTSMATPHVAGAAALYLETHPTDTPAQVRDALLSFTTKSKITSALSTNNHLLHIIEQTNGTGDYSSPSVIMSSPLDGSSQARRTAITLAATATDNTAISKVEFYANGTLLCTDTSAPYSCAWTTPNFVGTYRLQSIAYDAAGNTGSSGFVTITVK